MSFEVFLLISHQRLNRLPSFPPRFYVAYLNTPKVQQAMGAFVNFTEFSGAVAEAFNTTGDDGREDGTVEDMRKLLDQGFTVSISQRSSWKNHC